MDIPSHLISDKIAYHYTSSKVALEAILGSGLLRFSAFNMMNDPYEYKIASSAILSWGGISEKENRSISQGIRKTILKDSKLACFTRVVEKTENTFKYAFTKPRSWAQYGDSQNGVCLGFNIEKLEKAIKSHMPQCRLYNGDVEYNLDSGLPSQKSILRYDQQKSLEGNIASHIDAYNQDIYFRKYSDFKDENEYRFVIVDILGHDSDCLYLPISGALEFIILGDRFHDIYHNLIRDFASKHEAEAYQLKYSKSPYLFELGNA